MQAVVFSRFVGVIASSSGVVSSVIVRSGISRKWHGFEKRQEITMGEDWLERRMADMKRTARNESEH